MSGVYSMGPAEFWVSSCQSSELHVQFKSLQKHRKPSPSGMRESWHWNKISTIYQILRALQGTTSLDLVSKKKKLTNMHVFYEMGVWSCTILTTGNSKLWFSSPPHRHEKKPLHSYKQRYSWNWFRSPKGTAPGWVYVRTSTASQKKNTGAMEYHWYSPSICNSVQYLLQMENFWKTLVHYTLSGGLSDVEGCDCLPCRAAVIGSCCESRMAEWKH